MLTEISPESVLGDWKTIIGESVGIDVDSAWRDLWFITAEDGSRYVLKRLGPWRNLPVADEARILQHVARRGVAVAEFLPTDRATLYAGPVEESFVLMPMLASDSFTAAEIVPLEGTIGAALAELHLALASYPWPADTAVERLHASLAEDLTLPPDVAEAFARHRDGMIAALTGLSTQLVHGDLTPENVLLCRPGVVSGFIDFDHLPMAPRVWDIARYLSRRVRLRWRLASPEIGPLDALPGFLAGYHQVSSLRAEEIRAIPAGIAAGNVIEVSYHQRILDGTLPRRRLPDHEAVLADTVEAARWHLANWDAVETSVRSSVT